ncbi:metallophosphoesterase family protein [Clostridium sp. 'White wine YQ']|uniref:metallophosphoesterase family protein n=1 Tax=Clostridium sp. 'White wine YQ' TaxID=3027474 RepID=UPI002366C947|nr:metallophosphoesterase family protein [Clostridium sp. 'White wine YQ']MDD7794202.1 metallophosphoesterase family protein [Clostridium sp. 'White wine YQ']
MDFVLKFDTKGKFKIVQFTDIHEGPEMDEGIGVMRKILDYERPNLVILTGDNIDGKCKTIEDVKTAISHIASPMENRKIPWAIVFGNHDDEHGVMSKEEMMKFYMSFDYNISQVGYKTFDRIGNYNLLVEGSKNKKPVLNLYFLDSGKYAPFFVGGYNWIKLTQALWYRKITFGLKQRYNKIIPSLMYFHIPLPEYKKAWRRGKPKGEKLDSIDSPLINICGGLFRVLINTKDVVGVFVGHDHFNNFVVKYKGILLGYAGYTGYGGYGDSKIPRGARVVLVNEANPTDIKTWLRREGDNELRKLYD